MIKLSALPLLTEDIGPVTTQNSFLLPGATIIMLHALNLMILVRESGAIVEICGLFIRKIYT
jgi:hypothetical protein